MPNAGITAATGYRTGTIPPASGGGKPSGGGMYGLPTYQSPAPQNKIPLPSNARDLSQSQLQDAINAAREYGVAGHVDTPYGVSYDTGGIATTAQEQQRSQMGIGWSPGAPPPLDLSSFWSKMGGQFAPPEPTAPPPEVAAPNPADRTAADAAVFGRAKDQVGQTERASMDALAGEMGARGMTDSSFMAGGAANILQKGQGELADTSRTQAIEQLKRASEVEDRNYAAKLQSRRDNMEYTSREDALRMQAYQAKQAFLDRILAIQTGNGGKVLY